MKNLLTLKYFLLLLVACTFVLTSCKKDGNEKKLRIDIGPKFTNELVILKLNNEEIFAKKILTNSYYDVTRILKFYYSKGAYELSVSVDGIEKKLKFKHKRETYIYLTYDKNSGEISIEFPKEKYNYDF